MTLQAMRKLKLVKTKNPEVFTIRDGKTVIGEVWIRGNGHMQWRKMKCGWSVSRKMSLVEVFAQF